MIRIQIYCFACKQVVDCTLGARRGRMIASTFEDMHLSEACMQEDEDGGQDQAGAGSGEENDGTDGAKAPAVSEGPTVDRSKGPH